MKKVILLFSVVCFGLFCIEKNNGFCSCFFEVEWCFVGIEKTQVGGVVHVNFLIF